MPLQATSGAASYDAFGGGVPTVINYIEDVFSTYLYTGTGAAQTITNGIDLSGKGGLVWTKTRTSGNAFAYGHVLVDTANGPYNYLRSNNTDAITNFSEATSFNSNGFNVGIWSSTNNNNGTYASWTFRKQPKFFDVVTFTSNGTGGATINHLLGSAPGCVIVKSTASVGDWFVYHRSYSAQEYLLLNSNTALIYGGRTVTTSSTQVTYPNGYFANSTAYVAYLFAHDAGGFGQTGTDNVISCGTYTGNGSATGPVVSLGYEPQWLMIKGADNTSNWNIIDNMRGMCVGSTDSFLEANSTIAESSANWVAPTSTGFQIVSSSSEVNINTGRYIYIAIRRGPMKAPTDATKVFGLSARTGTGANATVTGGQTDDAVLIKNRGSAVGDLFASRLTNTGYLVTSATTAEVAAGVTILQANPWDVMDGVKVGTTSTITNASANTFINYLFKRAPSFMDVVCYTGTGVARTVAHNLTVMPELIIIKLRSTGQNWFAGTQFGATKYSGLSLNSTAASGGGAQNTDYTSATGSNFNYGLGAQPTSSVFTTDATTLTNSNTNTYVAYLFATCAGVSKVGSYTGTATTLQVDCGFTAGARFVLIKRTDSTGDWYVWDTARGIVSGNDPYFLMNTTAAEVTSTDYIDTYSAGFEISSTAPAAINASGGTYIFLAIA